MSKTTEYLMSLGRQARDIFKPQSSSSPEDLENIRLIERQLSMIKRSNARNIILLHEFQAHSSILLSSPDGPPYWDEAKDKNFVAKVHEAKERYPDSFVDIPWGLLKDGSRRVLENSGQAPSGEETFYPATQLYPLFNLWSQAFSLDGVIEKSLQKGQAPQLIELLESLGGLERYNQKIERENIRVEREAQLNAQI